MPRDNPPARATGSLESIPERKLWPSFWEATPDTLVEPLPSTNIGIAHVSRLDYPPEDHVYPVLADTHVITLNLMDIPKVEMDINGIRWDRPVPSGAVTILQARARMNLKIRTNYDCLSFFIPDQLIQELARDAGLAIDSKSPITPVVRDEQLWLLGQKAFQSIMSSHTRLDLFQAEMVAKAFAARVLSHFAVVTADERKKGGLPAHILRRVAMRIESDLARPPSLSDLAEDARVSPYHFCRAFRRSAGVTLSTYIANKRLDRARSLLLNTELPISNIATASGYNSASHFARMFKSEVGMSPRQFRYR